MRNPLQTPPVANCQYGNHRFFVSQSRSRLSQPADDRGKLPIKVGVICITNEVAKNAPAKNGLGRTKLTDGVELSDPPP
jgi:hypothetical protein